MAGNKAQLSESRIENLIHLIRGQRVMLASDIAAMYGVETKVLLQAVKRNIRRFPDDFMFRLTKEENDSLRSQIVTLKLGRGEHKKYLPYAFTEQGVAMLSSVLRSQRAIRVNIEIVRTFVRLRGIINSHVLLARKLQELEKKYDSQFRVVFDALRELMMPAQPRRKQIGFRRD